MERDVPAVEGEMVVAGDAAVAGWGGCSPKRAPFALTKKSVIVVGRRSDG